MGCFSFLCLVCNKPINSNSQSGQHCTLFLLEGGEAIEEMTGQYDSYGRVFDESMNSVEWDSYEWHGICDLMFDDDETNGIAAIHTKCGGDETVPACQSDSDPEQGWGKYKQTTNTTHKHVIYNSK